jgi:hypothetical protein
MLLPARYTELVERHALSDRFVVHVVGTGLGLRCGLPGGSARDMIERFGGVRFEFRRGRLGG